MHYHLEIVMPPVADVNAAVEQILKPFREHNEYKKYAFWDFYVIGGRWSGEKVRQAFPKERLDAFNALLVERGVTVSSFRAGKEELSPASQIPMVDALWREHFPESSLTVCPLFNHFNDQYENSKGYPDICTLKDIPDSLIANQVIIAGPHWDDEKFPDGLEAKYRCQDSVWNGCNHEKTAWDGTVKSAVEEFQKTLERAKPEYAAKRIPQDDWLVVTVDYHN